MYNDYIILCSQHAIDRARQRFGWGIGELKRNIGEAIKAQGLKTSPDAMYRELINGNAIIPIKKVNNSVIVILTVKYLKKPMKIDGKLKFCFVDKRRYKPKHYR